MNRIIFLPCIVGGFLSAQTYKIQMQDFELKGKVVSLEEAKYEFGMDYKIKKDTIKEMDRVFVDFDNKGYVKKWRTEHNQWGYIHFYDHTYSPKFDEVTVNYRFTEKGNEKRNQTATFVIYNNGVENIFERKDFPSVKKDASGLITEYLSYGTEVKPTGTKYVFEYTNKKLKNRRGLWTGEHEVVDYDDMGRVSHKYAYMHYFYTKYNGKLLTEYIDYPVKSDPKPVYHRYEYVFDPMGNWIQKVEYRRYTFGAADWKVYNVFTRKIGYSNKKTTGNANVDKKALDNILVAAQKLPKTNEDPFKEWESKNNGNQRVNNR